MVKRIVAIGFALFLVFVLSIPAFASDEFAYPIDVLGVGFENANGINIVADNGIVSGDDFRNFVSDTSVVYNPTYFDIYIAYPVHYQYVTVTVTTRAFESTNTCSVGTLSYQNGYSPVADCSVSATLRGTPYLDGSRCRTWTFRIAVPEVTQTVNFIRLRLTPPDNGFMLSRVLEGGNITGTMASGGYINTGGTINNSNLLFEYKGATGLDGTIKLDKSSVALSGTVPACYVNGRLRSYYGSGTSEYTDYTLGSSTTGRYLQIPSHSISLTASKDVTGSIDLDFHSGDNFGTVTGHSNTQLVSGYNDPVRTFSGVLGDSSQFKEVLHIQASGITNDSALIDAVETGFAQNHQDLSNISSKLGTLVDHQTQVDTTGTQIGSTTSTQTISGTSGDLSTGVSALDESISTVTDISGFVSASTPYINLLSIGMAGLLDFGDGILLWAFLAIVVLSAILFLLGKLSE